MSTRTVGLSRPSRFLVRMAALASLATLLAVVFFSAPAKASHFIRPGWFPTQLSPYYQPPAGIPAPDPYVSTEARGCDGQGNDGGTYLLLRYLSHWYPRGENWGIYACRTVSGSSSYSLHAEGRALDFHLENYDPYDKAHADQIWYFFLRQDYGSGHPTAMARRFGIQEIIWNCRIWTPSGGARLYSRCDPNSPKFTTNRTYRHENHIHIGQNPYGAGGHTTAYTGYWLGH